MPDEHKLRDSAWLRPILQQLPVALDSMILPSDSVLDVGCGENSPLRKLKHPPAGMVGIDAFPGVATGIHDEYIVGSALSIEKRFRPQSFDCVVALDVIEHLTKADGYRLIRMMERIARRTIVIFTPNGFLSQLPYEGNPFQEHLSGWTVEEMRGRGYEVIGLFGWKPLRGDCANIRFRPRRFWQAISIATQPVVRRRPEHAFALLCVKHLD
ncbi:MAG: class I SAM-dependent methyltransferase [Candidatus Binataceae bacterium]